MLKMALFFAVIAVIAALFGFTGIAAGAAAIAKILFFIFVVGWLVAWAAFHVAAGGIHLLLVLAVVFLIVHLMRGRSAV